MCLVRAVVDDDEYARTKKIVEQFAKGSGRELHEQLKNNIEKRQERNWVRKIHRTKFEIYIFLLISLHDGGMKKSI